MGGDAAVVHGARICYQSTARTPNADEKLIQRLISATPKHNTVFEHAVFRFGVKCPLFVARQWMRHRICTFNEKSLRYCVADREYYVPADQNAGREAYIAHMEASFDLYEHLLTQGWPKEQARSVLGLGVYTEFIWTVNAWSLMNWIEKRIDRHAQAEHRAYATVILDMFTDKMPVTARAFREVVVER
jgi:thymidylate synthase (FAD)